MRDLLGAYVSMKLYVHIKLDKNKKLTEHDAKKRNAGHVDGITHKGGTC